MILVRVTFVSHINGAQCIVAMIPSCRVVQNQIQHISGITVIVPETLHLPLQFLFTGISQRGVYDSVSREVGMEELVSMGVAWLSQNFQLLSKYYFHVKGEKKDN